MSRVVFFDLDGTLTDPRAGIVGSIQYALAQLQRPFVAEADLLWCIGPPLRESFVQLLDGEADADRAVSLYRERFADTGLFENELYAGIESALGYLCEQGVELHVATSKPHVYARRIVEHFGLDGYFGEVFGSELTGERTDKSELLGHALAASGADRHCALMVGDRSHDMIGARANEMRGVGVLYGYGSRDELEGAGATTLVARTSELGVLLAGL